MATGIHSTTAKSFPVPTTNQLADHTNYSGGAACTVRTARYFVSTDERLLSGVLSEGRPAGMQWNKSTIEPKTTVQISTIVPPCRVM